jgi:hypothetical protein
MLHSLPESALAQTHDGRSFSLGKSVSSQFAPHKASDAIHLDATLNRSDEFQKYHKGQLASRKLL